METKTPKYSKALELLQRSGWTGDKAAAAKIEANANEVMNPENTGKGAELVPDEVFMNDIVQMIPEYSRLLPMLPGSHGTNMPQKLTISMLGEPDFFQKGSDWEDQATSPVGPDKPTHQAVTASLSITQAKFEKRIALSDGEIRFAVVSGADLDAKIQEHIAKSGARTVDALILNGDTTATATGNVNTDDGAPTGTEYYLGINNGIRKLAIDNSNTVDVGTLAFADLISVQNKLGDYASNPTDCLWIFNRQTLQKFQGVDEFSKQYINGINSTVSKGVGAITNILGSDVMIHRDFGLTEADGKISATPSNNTLGGFAYIYKPAVQYGWGAELAIEPVRIAGKGVEFVATMWFGFTIAYPAVAGGSAIIDPTVALAINGTL